MKPVNDFRSLFENFIKLVFNSFTGSIRPGVIGGSKPRNVSNRNSNSITKIENSDTTNDGYRTDSSIFGWDIREKLFKQENR